MSDATSDLGLTCPDGGDFYICAGNSTEFIGCCTSDPCADDSGNCQTSDLRASSFSNDSYASIPEQHCDDARGARVWYTCRDDDPPFLGCCGSDPCGEGCPRDHLIAAALSEDEDDRLAFAPYVSSSIGTSSTSATATATATASGSAQSSEGGSGGGDDGLSSGAIAGIAIGAVLAVVILLIVTWKFGWMAAVKRKKRSVDGHDGPDGQQPEMEYMYKDHPGPNHNLVRDSYLSFATTATANPHASGFRPSPTSPDFPKKTHPHQHQHSYSQPPSPGYPSTYTTPSAHGSPYMDQHAAMLSPHSRHTSHLSTMSGMTGTSSLSGGMRGIDPNLFPVSEIDGTERDPQTEAPPVELPADENTQGTGREQRFSLPATDGLPRDVHNEGRDNGSRT